MSEGVSPSGNSEDSTTKPKTGKPKTGKPKTGLSRLANFFRHGVTGGHHHGSRSASKRPVGRTVATLAMAGLLAFSSLVGPMQQAHAATYSSARVSTTTTTTTTTMNTVMFIVIMSAAANNSRNAATRAPAEYTTMPEFSAFSQDWAVNRAGLGLVWHDDGEMNYTLGKHAYDHDMSAGDAQAVFKQLQQDEDFLAVGDHAAVNLKSIATVKYDDGKLKFSVNGYDKNMKIAPAAAKTFLDKLAEHEDYTRLANGTVVQSDLITKASYSSRHDELTVTVMGKDIDVDMSADKAADFLKTLAEKDNYATVSGTTVVNVNLPSLFSYDGDDVRVYTGSRSKEYKAGADDWQKLKADLAGRDHFVEIPGGKKGGMLNVYNVDYASYDRDDGEMTIHYGSGYKTIDMTTSQAKEFFDALAKHDRFFAVDADHTLNTRSVLYAATDDEDLDIKIGKHIRSIDLGNNANAEAALDALQKSDAKFRIFPDDDGERLVNTKAVGRAWFSKGFWWWPWDDDNLKYQVGRDTFAPDYSEADTKAYFNKLVDDEEHVVDSEYGPINTMAVTEVWYDDGELNFRIGSNTYSADASDAQVRDLVSTLAGVKLPESYDYDAMSKKDKKAPEKPAPQQSDRSTPAAIRPRG